MSLFEWIGESYNPGARGSIQFSGEKKTPRTNGIVLLRFLIALIIIAVIYYLVFDNICQVNLKNAAIISGVILAYCLIGYFVRPQPDTSNIGLLGGLIDHPFRYSDDINRFLIFLKIFLMPGYFLMESVINIFLLLRNSNK